MSYKSLATRIGIAGIWFCEDAGWRLRRRGLAVSGFFRHLPSGLPLRGKEQCEASDARDQGDGNLSRGDCNAQTFIAHVAPPYQFRDSNARAAAKVTFSDATDTGGSWAEGV
jgi:hypothetical protein